MAYRKKFKMFIEYLIRISSQHQRDFMINEKTKTVSIKKVFVLITNNKESNSKLTKWCVRVGGYTRSIGILLIKG